MSRRGGSRSRTLIGVLAFPVLLASCSSVSLAPSVSIETVEGPAQSQASIHAVPSGPDRAKPVEPVIVTATGGLLADVEVRGPKGIIPGTMSDDGTSWQSDVRSLRYDTTYTVSATAIDVRGVPVSSTSEFTTVAPDAFFSGTVVSPGSGAMVGVGMPLIVSFDHTIKNRADVERALVVHTPTPIEGAWAWRDERTVEFRPFVYWPGNIDVQLTANLNGVQASRDVYGKGLIDAGFSTGPSMVTKVNAKEHVAKVFRDGELVRTIPITTGKDGFETRSGTKVIVSKERTRLMDAATGGTNSSDPEYYRLTVEYAMRVTYSGEFLHAAPWSVGSQGRANVSHGCIGMSTSNAEWLYGQTMVGDVVEVTGTSNKQNLGNGITVWTESWPDWLSRSSAGRVVTTPTKPRSESGGSSASPDSASPSPTVTAAPSVGPSATASSTSSATPAPSATPSWKPTMALAPSREPQA